MSTTAIAAAASSEQVPSPADQPEPEREQDEDTPERKDLDELPRPPWTWRKGQGKQGSEGKAPRQGTENVAGLRLDVLSALQYE